MDIEEYQSKDIAGKILYLASMFKGMKEKSLIKLNHKYLRF